MRGQKCGFVSSNLTSGSLLPTTSPLILLRSPAWATGPYDSSKITAVTALNDFMVVVITLHPNLSPVCSSRQISRKKRNGDYCDTYNSALVKKEASRLGQLLPDDPFIRLAIQLSIEQICFVSHDSMIFFQVQCEPCKF